MLRVCVCWSGLVYLPAKACSGRHTCSFVYVTCWYGLHDMFYFAGCLYFICLAGICGSGTQAFMVCLYPQRRICTTYSCRICAPDPQSLLMHTPPFRCWVFTHVRVPDTSLICAHV